MLTVPLSSRTPGRGQAATPAELLLSGRIESQPVLTLTLDIRQKGPVMRRPASLVATFVAILLGVGLTNPAQAQQPPDTTTTTALPSDGGDSVQDCVDPANPQGGFISCEDLVTTTTTTTGNGASGTTSTTNRRDSVVGARQELPRTGVSLYFMVGLGLASVLGGAGLSRIARGTPKQGKR